MVDEEARLAALYGYHVLDTERPAALDELAALTAAIFEVPAVAISLVDRDRVWFAGVSGWGLSEVPRATSFATHVVSGEALVVPDTRLHPVFGGYAGGPAPVRSYAGAPVVGAGGHVLGSLCLLGAEPRDFSAAQLAVLTGLAAQAARHLETLRDRHLAAELRLELVRVHQREEDFVAAVTHELRTPITVMQGYLETLADIDELAAYRPMIDPIRRNGDRLVRMVDHLLAGAHPQETAVTIQPGQVDLRSVARAALGGCLIEATEHDMLIRFEADCGPMPISGDFGRLCQVTEQLLRNALAFSPDGGEVTVRVSDRFGPTIEIIDRGVGVPADELPFLPERFYRGRHAREHAVAGVGLGLNIAERIVAAHGGTLSITSDGAGTGTTARLSIPALQQRAERCSVTRPVRRGRPGRRQRP